jgi:hypothetical protein
MPYIKISDPNIIDLAAWHQVINVVNQHSDSISSITNNFGIKGAGATAFNTSDDYAHEFDQGSQKIIFGRYKVNTTGEDKDSSTAGDDMFYGRINFVDDNSGTASFSAKPVVTTTVQYGYGDVVPAATGSSIVCTTYNLDAEGFNFRVKDANSKVSSVVKLTGFFYINWTAVGPKI